MMRNTFVGTAVALVMVAGSVPQGVEAQFRWPDEPQDLQVLGDISGARLGTVMRNWTAALGVRCSHCHIPGDQSGLEHFDFVSSTEAKEKTRLMVRMVREINGSLLAGVEDHGVAAEDRLRVGCTTCHRGAPRPETIDDILAATIADEGIDAAEARYRELREAYFGGFTYDFRPEPLIDVARTLARRGDEAEALRLMAMMLEFYPEDGEAHVGNAQVLEAAGRTEDAIAAWERAAEFLPENQRPQVDAQIRRLRGG